MCVINYDEVPYVPLTQEKLKEIAEDAWPRCNGAWYIWWTVARDMMKKGTLKPCPEGCHVWSSAGTPALCEHGNWSFTKADSPPTNG